MMNSAFFHKILVLLWGCTRSRVVSGFVQRSVPINRITSRKTTRTRKTPNDMLVCCRESILRAEENTDNNISDRVMEKAWRHAKKTLISVGGKGATIKHGNNLRQLLEDHTIVKVKVNTKSFGTMENAVKILRDFAVESGASENIEIVQMREKDRTILFGLPRTSEKIEDGSFPPPPPPPWIKKEYDDVTQRT
mmetsp:Transcript_3311/g.3786  ORF Transcript_3311/g.3786 Transcript_3311/m.3786 type:complete len:193 (+) Transcript_3311:44-622(+)